MHSVHITPVLEPRPYQREAVGWALNCRQAVCCLPTGTGKTLVGLLWAKALLDSEQAHRFLILEPTRLLVNQIAEYFLEKAGATAIPIDGRISREKRTQLWRTWLVVTTPETAYNDLPYLNFDAVVVDECHHTVGQDAFARLLEAHSFTYRLGLSATVPEKRHAEVERLVGPVRQWSWTDPAIRDYVPDWIGEVYESALSQPETEVLRTIRQLPSAPGLSPGMLERYLARDGVPALRETLQGRGKLAEAYGPRLLPMLQGWEDALHKWAAVEEVLAGHDFEKAVIFVERICIAHLLGEWLRDYNPALLMGKRKAGSRQDRALQLARRDDCRVVISTSAGEEGVDLPSADLLIVCGNVASEIRFIQRQGRIMRRTGNRLKFATFVVTPETVDYDSFVRGLETAIKKGAVDVEQTFGWDPDILWPRTTWWHISESLRGNPRPLAGIEEHLHVRGNVAQRVIDHAAKRGRLFYVYDVTRIVQDACELGERWFKDWWGAMAEDREGTAPSGTPFTDPEWPRRIGWRIGTSWGGKMRQYRVYALADDVAGLYHSRPDLFSDLRQQVTAELIVAGEGGRRARRSKPAATKGTSSTFTLGKWFGFAPGQDATHLARKLRERDDVFGLVFQRRKHERLEYWCKPQTPEIMEALARNFARFLELMCIARDC